ncbi:MAG: hypothetical protein KDK12_07800 [Rhodobacteraceae bacterium]|nr:hypothetical protein [Paracoccaceae bacterium]
MDQTDTGLKAVMKALSDVVEPALDPADPLAREQLRLAIEYVGFVRKRIDYLHGRERFDLRHYAGVARAFVAAGLPDDAPGASYLRQTLVAGEALLAQAGARTDQLREGAMELGHVVSTVVQGLGSLPAPMATALRRIVLDATEEKLHFERLWYAPVGFEAVLPTGRSLEDFLR